MSWVPYAADYTRFSRTRTRRARGNGDRLPRPRRVAARARRRARALARPRRRRRAARRGRRRRLRRDRGAVRAARDRDGRGVRERLLGGGLAPERRAASAAGAAHRPRHRHRDRGALVVDFVELPELPAPPRLGLRAAVRGAPRRLAGGGSALHARGRLRRASRGGRGSSPPGSRASRSTSGCTRPARLVGRPRRASCIPPTGASARPCRASSSRSASRASSRSSRGERRGSGALRDGARGPRAPHARRRRGRASPVRAAASSGARARSRAWEHDAHIERRLQRGAPAGSCSRRSRRSASRSPGTSPRRRPRTASTTRETAGSCGRTPSATRGRPSRQSRQRRTPIWIDVCALTRTDFPPADARGARGRRTRLLVDLQGLVRTPTIGPLQTDEHIGDVLHYVEMLKLNDEEAETLVGSAEPEKLQSARRPGGDPHARLARGLDRDAGSHRARPRGAGRRPRWTRPARATRTRSRTSSAGGGRGARRGRARRGRDRLGLPRDSLEPKLAARDDDGPTPAQHALDPVAGPVGPCEERRRPPDLDALRDLDPLAPLTATVAADVAGDRPGRRAGRRILAAAARTCGSSSDSPLRRRSSLRSRRTARSQPGRATSAATAASSSSVTTMCVAPLS